MLQENGESDTKATEEKDDFGGEISREKDGIELHSIEIHSDRTQVRFSEYYEWMKLLIFKLSILFSVNHKILYISCSG